MTNSTMKISILFLYLRMTPERSHKIAIYVIMGFVFTHEIASLVVRPLSPRYELDVDFRIGRDLSMRTDRRILVSRKSTPELKMH